MAAKGGRRVKLTVKNSLKVFDLIIFKLKVDNPRWRPEKVIGQQIFHIRKVSNREYSNRRGGRK